jgi:hypothetical protein
MLKTPLPLGPFIIQEGGRLTLRRDDPKPAFWFIWRGRRVEAKLAEGGTSFSIVIGRTPTTARASAAREPAFALLRALPGTLPTGWSLRLTPEHTIRMQAVQEMVWPATVAELIEPLVRFLLNASPYLDMADQCGLGMSA